MKYGKTCTDPGWYWYRTAPGIPASVVRVLPDYEEPDRLSFIIKDEKIFTDQMPGELCGPVPEPPFEEHGKI